jgi:outer membrane protein assembly factor BamA
MLLASLLIAAQLVAASTGQETLVEIRIHGNHTTPDQIVLTLAGLVPNQPFNEQMLEDAEQRLIASGRFERVQVLKRFRSIDDPSQILAVILVDERPGVQPDGRLPGPFGRLLGQSMWAPILGFEDGYGFTYGARVSLVDPLGPRSRVSIPLSWGGERQAALEVERSFSGPIVNRLFGAVSVKRRENPFFEIGDTRQSASIGVDRVLIPSLTASASGRVVHVRFDDLDESHRAVGGQITFDTRRDPTFPRNAIYAQTGLERMSFDGREGVTRWTSDVRGYIGLIGPAVLALTAAMDRASAPLPPYEQRLLGGSSSLRGYRAGFDVGDSVAIASAELRVPVTSPLSVGRLGVKAFTDLGAVWNRGERLVDQQWSRGIGGGAFLTLTAFTAGLDVAWNESGHARWHLTLGVKF